MGATDPKGEGYFAPSVGSVGHVTGGRSPAHELARLLPSSRTKRQVQMDLAVSKAEMAVRAVRDARRAVEFLNDYALGAATNAADLEMTNVRNRLKGMSN